MDSHQVARKRESVEAALGKIKAKTLVVGISSDLLFPIHEQQFLAAHIPNAQFKVISSVYGHDGFLVEFEQFKQIVRNFLLSENKLEPIHNPSYDFKTLEDFNH